MSNTDLVPGGTGFIGSNVVRLLQSEKWKVQVIDNLSSGYRIIMNGNYII